MSARTVGLSLLLLLSSLPSIATAHSGLLTQGQADPGEFDHRTRRLDDGLKGAVRDAEVEGWNLYRYESLQDLASYLAGKELDQNTKGEIEGSIVTHDGDWRVRLYRMEMGRPAILADVVLTPGYSPVLVQENLRPLSSEQLAMIDAQQSVEAVAEHPCEGPYNFVTLPAANGDGWWVYQLRLVERGYRVPQGLHVRYQVSADGSMIENQMAYGRRCSLLGRDTAPEEGEEVEAINMTDSSESAPTALHVYLSLRYGQKLYIATLPSNLFWTVEDGVVAVDR